MTSSRRFGSSILSRGLVCAARVASAARAACAACAARAACVACVACVACAPATTRTPAGGASAVQPTKIIMLAPEGLQGHNIEPKRLASWLSGLRARSVRVLSGDRGHRDVFVYLVLYRDRAPDIRVAARPALPPGRIARLQRELGAAPRIRTRYVSFPLAFVLKVNRGCPKGNQPFSPPLSTLHPSAKTRFIAATLPQRLALLKRWARRGILPIVGEILSGVDAKFKGVRGVGAMLKGLPTRGRYDVDRLTIRSQAFWRAALEMVRGDVIIPAVRIFLHVANGEVDRARQQMELVHMFAKDGSPAAYLLKQLSRRLKVFSADVNRRVRAGIALHDRKQFDRAIRVYRRLLAEYPHSAWARYEAYLSRHSRDAARAGSKAKLFYDWRTAKKAIFAEDPLYSSNAAASTGVEAYETLLRLEIRGLFKRKRPYTRDYLRLADIALDLGVYGEAAQMYLMVVLYIKKSVYGTRPMFAHFLYCLEKLGVTGLKAAFKGNHAARFAKIAAERRRLMESSPVYKAMSRKRPGASSGHR